MKIYKGSTKVDWVPDIKPYSRLLSYGAGVYASTDSKMEGTLAKERARRTCGVPVINVYNFYDELADKTLAVKRFSNDNLDWAFYIMANRAGKYEGPEYDIIYGPAPDTEDYLQIRYMEYRNLSTYDIKDNIKPKKRTLRIIFKTQKALACIRFLKTISIPAYGKRAEYERDILPDGTKMPGDMPDIVSSTVRYVAIKTGLPCREIITKLYSSKLFKDLSDENLKVWRFSYAALGEMLISELKTGCFIYPDADDVFKLEDSCYVYALEDYRRNENISGRQAIEIFEKYDMFNEIKERFAYYNSPPNMDYKD
ncbi:MAG: DUF3990 domain-containing protein, partial [Elusimicrobiales bacterium]|nr:DUF3990 domain-containing protein [Elusimicrobiales bacterium]